MKNSTPVYCPDCKGTGADAKKTADAKRRGLLSSDGSYIRCWTCNGNGLDPAHYFQWSKSPTVLGDLSNEHRKA